MGSVRESIRRAVSRSDHLVPCCGYMVPREAAARINEKYARSTDATLRELEESLASIRQRRGTH